MQRRLLPALLLCACASTPAAAPGQAAKALGCGDEEADGSRRPQLTIQRSHGSKVTALAYSSDGSYLASVANDDAVRIWSASGRLLRVMRLGREAYPTSVAWGPASRVAVGSSSGLWLFDVTDPKWMTQTPTETRVDVMSLGDNPLATWLTRFQYRGSFSFLDAMLQPVGDAGLPPTSKPPYLEALVVSQDHRRAVGVSKSSLFVWDLPQPAPVSSVPIGASEAVAVDPTGAYALTSESEPGPRIISLRDGAITPLEKAGDSFPSAPALALSEQLAVLASFEGITAWNKDTGKLRWRWPPVKPEGFHPLDASLDTITALAFAPSGKRLVAATATGRLLELEAGTGRKLKEFGGFMSLPLNVEFVDGDSFVTRSASAVRRWSLKDAEAFEAIEATEFAGVVRIEGGRMLMVHRRMPNQSCPSARAEMVVTSWSGPYLPGDTPAASSVFCQRLPNINPGAWLEPNGLRHGEVLELASDELDGGFQVRHFQADSAVKLAKSEKALWFEHRFSRDGKRLVASRAFSVGVGGACVWNTASGALERCGTISIEIGSDGRKGTAIAVEAPDELAFWSEAGVSALSADGRTLAVATGSGLVGIFAESADPITLMLDKPLSALSFTQAGSDLLVGAQDGSLALVRGNSVLWMKPGDGGSVRSIETDPSDRRALAITEEGAIQVWDLASARQLATLIETAEGEWAAVSPEGMFASSQEASKQVGWVFEAPLQFSPIDQFQQTYFSQSWMRSRLRCSPVPAVPVPERPPEVTSLRTEPGSTASSTILHVASSPNASGGAVRVFSNARPVAEAPVEADGETTLPIALSPGVNRLAVLVVDRRGLSSNTATLDVQGSSDPDSHRLFVIGIGINSYPRLPPGAQLSSAVADAKDFVAILARRGRDSKFYGEVRELLLTDAQAEVSPSSIRTTLARLGEMRSGDVALVLLAGHGARTKDRGAAFLTSRADVNAPDLAEHSVNWAELGRSLGAAKGNVMVFVDACHAGGLSPDVAALPSQVSRSLFESGRAGALVFAASKGREQSRSAPDHGYFTQAVLATFRRPESDTNADGYLDSEELIASVTELVSEATRKKQTPWVAQRELFGDILLMPVDPGPPVP